MLIITAAPWLSACSQSGTDAKTFAELIKKEQAPQLIDVRTPQEFAGGYIEGAMLMDYNSPDFQAQALKLDKTRPVYVYCLAGGRSSSATEFLKKAGYKNVYNLKGGINAWKNESLPTVMPNAKPGKPQGETFKSWSKAEVDELIAKNPKVLIDFYAPWCGPCRKMEPDMAQIEKEGKLSLIRVNLDTNRELANVYGITEIPVLLCFNKGKQTMRLEGIQSKASIYDNFK